MWNGGAYWEALKRFILYAKKNDAEFLTFKELYNKMNKLMVK